MKFLPEAITIFFSLVNFKFTFASRSLEDKELLNGIDFRVSSYEYPPFMSSRRENGNVTHTGVMVNSVAIMAAYFKMRIVYVPVDPVMWAKKGPGTTIIHQLETNEVDGAFYPFQQILEILDLIDLSYPMTVENYILMQPFPNETTRFSEPIKPFTTTVWLYFIVSTIAFIISMTMIMYTRQPSDNVFHQHRTVRGQLYIQIEYVLKIITSQGSGISKEIKCSLYRLMIAVWLLSMVVLINAYIGTYTAHLALLKREPTVNTLEELASSNKFKITIDYHSDLAYKSLSAETGPYKTFGDTFRRYPELLFTQPLEAIPNVINFCCAFPSAVNFINYLINMDFKAHGKCRLTMATKLLSYSLPFSNGLQKNSPYTNIIDHEFMLRMWENGIMYYMGKNSFPRAPRRCLINSGQNNKKVGVGPTPFRITEFSGIFVMLLVGYGFAILIFIAEILIVIKLKPRTQIIN